MSLTVKRVDRAYADVSNVLKSCYGVLSNRDHSSSELREKQIAKGYDDEMVDEAIDKLIEQGYVNDTLFAKGYFTSRVLKGHGPIRVRRDMNKRRISKQLIDDHFESFSDKWIQHCIKTKQKKFGTEFSAEKKWRDKVFRFLTYRGFLTEHILEALNSHSDWLETSDLEII